MPYHVPLQGKLGGKRTLVLIEKNEYRQTYSIFFDLIQQQGHNLIIRTCDDKEMKLKNYGEYLFDNIVLFSEIVGEFATITLGSILDFVNDGGNLLFASSGKINDSLRLFAAAVLS